METQSQSEQPTDEPKTEEEVAPEEATLRQAQGTAEAEAAPKAEDEDVDRIRPIRGADVGNAGKQILQTAKDGILRPAYEIGWRWLNGGQAAAEAFFEGALGGKKKGKK